MKFQSIARRTMGLVILAEMFCALAFSGTALWHERASRIRSFDVMLQGRSDSLLGAVRDTEDAADDVAVDPGEFKPSPGDVYALYSSDGKLLSSSPGAPPEVVHLGRDGISERRSDRHRYRLIQRKGLRIIDRDENAGAGIRRPVTIVYAARTNGVWHEILEAARFYVLVSASLLLMTALLLVLLLRRALKPLEELATSARGVSKASLDFKAPESALHIRELAPLAQALSNTINSLRRAFEMEARFVSDAAHELKTAVAVARSSLQLLMLRSRTQQELTAGMHRLLEDNKRVEDLVTRMLTLARMEEGLESPAAPSDLSETIRQTLAHLQPYAEVHLVHLRIKVDDRLPVPISKEQADTLVSNLVVNAIQYSRPNSEVNVSTSTDGNHATLIVSDAGMGISPEALPHVFERFYREDRSRSRDTGGAGLGLAICKSIVDGAGGKIDISSTTGEGTTAKVTFMLA